jgi:hypothetical protein
LRKDYQTEQGSSSLRTLILISRWVKELQVHTMAPSGLDDALILRRSTLTREIDLDRQADIGWGGPGSENEQDNMEAILYKLQRLEQGTNQHGALVLQPTKHRANEPSSCRVNG